MTSWQMMSILEAPPGHHKNTGLRIPHRSTNSKRPQTQTRAGRRRRPTRRRGMRSSVSLPVPRSSKPPNGQYVIPPSSRTSSRSPVALAIDSNRRVSVTRAVCRNMRGSSHPIHLPTSLNRGTKDISETSGKEPSQHRTDASMSEEMGSSAPIDIPSSQDERSQKALDFTKPRDGDGEGQETNAVESCWSAAWYSSQPWNRTTEFPERTPAHIMIWEKRALRSASFAAVEAAESRRRRGGGLLEGAPSGDDSSSEDNSIFEMDL